MSNKDDDIMGIEGLAKYLNLSKSTVYKLAQEGSLPSQKVGKHWRFRQETVNRWLDGELAGKPAADMVRPAQAAAPVAAQNAGDRLLNSFDGRFSNTQIEKLKARWIETVDQFFSIASTQAGAAGLVALLGMADEEFAPWVKAFEKEIVSGKGFIKKDDGGGG